MSRPLGTAALQPMSDSSVLLKAILLPCTRPRSRLSGEATRPSRLALVFRPWRRKESMRAVGRDRDPSPLLMPELSRRSRLDRSRGWPSPKAPDAARRAGRSGWPCEARDTPRHQYRRTEPIRLSFSATKRGGVDTHRPKRGPHVAEVRGERESSQPDPLEGTILGGEAAPFPLNSQIKREEASPFPRGVRRRRLSLSLGDRTSRSTLNERRPTR